MSWRKRLDQKVKLKEKESSRAGLRVLGQGAESNLIQGKVSQPWLHKLGYSIIGIIFLRHVAV